MVQIWSAVAAASIAACAALIGVTLGGRHEHEHWLRSERHGAYIALLEVTFEILHNARSGTRDLKRLTELAAQLAHARDSVLVLGPTGVASSAIAFAEEASRYIRSTLPAEDTADKISSLRDAFITAARGTLEKSRHRHS